MCHQTHNPVTANSIYEYLILFPKIPLWSTAKRDINSHHPFLHVPMQCEFEPTSIKWLSLLLNLLSLIENKANEANIYNPVPCLSEQTLANGMWVKAWNVLVLWSLLSLASLWSPQIAVQKKTKTKIGYTY